MEDRLIYEDVGVGGTIGVVTGRTVRAGSNLVRAGARSSGNSVIGKSNVLNPYGKAGGLAHQNGINTIENNIVGRGLEPYREFPITNDAGKII